MRKITFAIAGMGNRGMQYALKQLKYPEEMQVCAIADIKKVRLDAANQFLNLPKESIFQSAEELLEHPRLADVLVIATQDLQHRDHALKALEKGYHLLLEKPISTRLEECREIAAAAKRFDRKVIVCHVLRYTVFYQEIKRLIDEGAIGKVQAIEATEQIGFYHFAHSFVRGNWHKESDSSPMILAKCCHDMDLFLWLTGKRCERISSFGSLDFFRRENMPENAKDRCTDGCEADCVFHAQKFYYSRIPGWPSNILHPEPTEDNILDVLKSTNYGRCVFKMDNDVADHQVVNLLLEDGVTVNFTASAFTNRQTRSIRVMGTKGELVGEMKERKLSVRIFGQPEYEVDLDSLCDDFTGHGGGDARMIYDVIRFIRGDDFDSTGITSIERSMESHYAAFAAEKSRTRIGEVVQMDEYIKEMDAVSAAGMR